MLKTPDHFSPIAVASASLSDRPPGELFSLYFRGVELLITEKGDAPAALSHASTVSAIREPIVVGQWRNQWVTATALNHDQAAPAGARWAGLRSLFGVMPDELVAIAGRSTQLLEWDRTHAYCGACSTPTERDLTERSRRCPTCGHAAYPRISPAMMCLVTRGDEILLARNVNFPAGRFSALAGFLEAGESVEDAVHREVREEVGIELGNLSYFASQSWPFPHSLMIAFTAEYAGGELTPNGVEIAEAAWFDAENLPQLPPRISIARALIEDTLDKIRMNTTPAT